VSRTGAQASRDDELTAVHALLRVDDDTTMIPFLFYTLELYVLKYIYVIVPSKLSHSMRCHFSNFDHPETKYFA